MQYFLQTQEIKGASGAPAHHHEIELDTFQVISTTEIEIAVPAAEIAAKNQLQVYAANQSLMLAKALIWIVFEPSSHLTDSGILLKNVSVSKARLGAGGVTFFTLSSVVNRVRDLADGLPTGQRMHKPFVITKELDQSAPMLYNALIFHENLTEWTVRFWTPTILTNGPKK